MVDPVFAGDGDLGKVRYSIGALHWVGTGWNPVKTHQEIDPIFPRPETGGPFATNMAS